MMAPMAPMSLRPHARPVSLAALASIALLALVAYGAGSSAPAAAAARPVAPSERRSAPPTMAEAMAFVTELPQGEVEESLAYRWRLQGMSGALAGLFFPRSGNGTLQQSRLPGGRLRSDLLITSQDSARGEFWSYGAEFDAVTSNTRRAWSSYVFRDKQDAKNQAVTEENITDITAGIHRLRRERPTGARRQRIWSDGKTYAVVVTPLGTETIDLGRGVRRLADHYQIEGVQGPGERLWKGRIEVWLARDEAATPLKILIERGWASVLLALKPAPASDRQPLEKPATSTGVVEPGAEP
jgi:hypothetical protein